MMHDKEQETMQVLTSTFVKDALPTRRGSVVVMCEHQGGNDKLKAYSISVGCVDEWLSDADFETILRCMNKAKRVRKLALQGAGHE